MFAVLGWRLCQRVGDDSLSQLPCGHVSRPLDAASEVNSLSLQALRRKRLVSPRQLIIRWVLL